MITVPVVVASPSQQGERYFGGCCYADVARSIWGWGGELGAMAAMGEQGAAEPPCMLGASS